MPTAYELERAANIARNKALLEELELKEAVSSMAAPAKKEKKATADRKAKPVQPRKSALKRSREEDDDGPRRQSSRLRRTAAPAVNETPAQKRQREKEIAEREAMEAEERLVAEEEARRAKRPRHDDLDFDALAEGVTDADELPALRSTLSATLEQPYPRVIGDRDAFVFDDDDDREDAALADLKARMRGLRVAARAKVTQDRIYSAAWHPTEAKDLLFFGDKHGQLGIWDARALQGEDDDDDRPPEQREDGQYWRLQSHWPASSKSSVSSIKFDPLDAHSVYTSSYDCTVRHLSFTTGTSREVFHTGDGDLASAVELAPAGHAMWIANGRGWLTHADLREPAHSAVSFQLAEDKVGCVSVNPVDTHLLLTASNDRTVRIWDARKLHVLGNKPVAAAGAARRGARAAADEPEPEPRNFLSEEVTKFAGSREGKGARRGEWRHGRAVGAAYWDAHGRRIVSTCYDDLLRVWDFRENVLSSSGALPSMKPAVEIKHNTNTGRWVTPMKAQWSPNTEVYPHFTVGNMRHSLDVFACSGELVARLSDKDKITAVQAVTVLHPSIVERAASGNGSGRCVLWAPADTDEVEEEADEDEDEDEEA